MGSCSFELSAWVRDVSDKTRVINFTKAFIVSMGGIDNPFAGINTPNASKRSLKSLHLSLSKMDHVLDVQTIPISMNKNAKLLTNAAEHMVKTRKRHLRGIESR